MHTKYLASITPLFFLVACTNTPAPMIDDSDASSVSEDAVHMMDDGSVMMDHDMPDAPSDASTMEKTRVVDVTVTDWAFTPATIMVRRGEDVSLRITGDKGIHSVLVADLGLNVRVLPGESTMVTIPTDATGTFPGRCGVPCGPGHRDMAFTIIIE